MRVTKENGYALLLEYDGTAHVTFKYGEWIAVKGKEHPRVVEFPKFWRENGRQYKVEECYISVGYGYNGDVCYSCKEIQLVRIPTGAYFSAYGRAQHVEEY